MDKCQAVGKKDRSISLRSSRRINGQNGDRGTPEYIPVP